LWWCFASIFSSETAWQNEAKHGIEHIWKVIYKYCLFWLNPLTNMRPMPSYGKSSHCLWQCELKIISNFPLLFQYHRHQCQMFIIQESTLYIVVEGLRRFYIGPVNYWLCRKWWVQCKICYNDI
jgi:hypothetical protein